MTKNIPVSEFLPAPVAAIQNVDGPACGTTAASTPRLLVVEDQAVNRKVLKHQLAQLGVDCMLAENGVEALSLVSANEFDIIITDCAMPEMDGLELIRRLRVLETQGRRRSTVIALTAHVGAASAEHCYAAGADAYLAKPLRLAELAEALRQWHGGDPSHTASRTAAMAPQEASAAGGDAAIDSTALAAILGSEDPRLLRLTMRDFLSAWQESLPELRQLLEQRDADALCEAAHAAKGLAHYGAATRLAGDCGWLERLARERRWIEAAAAFEALAFETRRVQTQLAQLE
jgi:two-component system, sensor histidine kinase and response regulator